MDMAYSNGSVSSAELRKIRKPIIERRRRERINRCLDQIKSLVLKALNQDETKYEKMDKADILEMAVRHLLDNERSKVHSNYRTGFNRCTSQVREFLNNNNNNNNNNAKINNNNNAVDYNEVQKRLLGHLQSPLPLPSPPAGIFRPQPVLPAPMNFSTKAEQDDDDCLNCSTVSSTSSSVLSPSVRQRRDSGLSEDFSPDKTSLGASDESFSAFRRISTSTENVTRAACLGLAEYSIDTSDSESESETRSRGASPDLQAPVAPASSPVWRPW
ncbi:hypothetical protein CAPTEDRAFT_225285 [Capitella teleta]|uniref:BHLH domain-containing protein n=1 Tax=Capitella teleta TaxID=283909 RepID=R7U463_CAPTE|nr:hypothetical protein CAPTEDRAFT_225285 [Capitella teleta]|eukprot:ELT98466.1 hypothetical protein CAPTEDRAFT_225285 [Capitella teleta]